LKTQQERRRRLEREERGVVEGAAFPWVPAAVAEAVSEVSELDEVLSALGLVFILPFPFAV